MKVINNIFTKEQNSGNINVFHSCILFHTLKFVRKPNPISHFFRLHKNPNFSSFFSRTTTLNIYKTDIN